MVYTIGLFWLIKVRKKNELICGGGYIYLLYKIMSFSALGC